MQPVLVIPVQIPYHLFIQFKPLTEQLPVEVIQEWSEWCKDLYKDSRESSHWFSISWGAWLFRTFTDIFLYVVAVIARAGKSQINIG